MLSGVLTVSTAVTRTRPVVDHHQVTDRKIEASSTSMSVVVEAATPLTCVPSPTVRDPNTPLEKLVECIEGSRVDPWAWVRGFQVQQAPRSKLIEQPSNLFERWFARRSSLDVALDVLRAVVRVQVFRRELADIHRRCRPETGIACGKTKVNVPVAPA